MRFVLDASCVAKLALAKEAGHADFTAWYDTHHGEDLQAPRVLRYELGQILRVHRPVESPEALAELHERLLDEVELRDPAAKDTFRLALRGLTFADASYVALARESQAQLVSADRAMLRAARTLKVRTVAF